MPKKKHAEEQKKADLYAKLKRKIAPTLARIEVLGEELKAFFRSNPDVPGLGDVTFHQSEQTRLDTKALRAELGAGIAKFEKTIPIESLHVRKAA